MFLHQSEVPEIQHETGKRWHSYPWGAVSCCDCQYPKPQEYALQTLAFKKKERKEIVCDSVKGTV